MKETDPGWWVAASIRDGLSYIPGDSILCMFVLSDNNFEGVIVATYPDEEYLIRCASDETIHEVGWAAMVTCWDSFLGPRSA
jgi:hypothetical protein